MKGFLRSVTCPSAFLLVWFLGLRFRPTIPSVQTAPSGGDPEAEGGTAPLPISHSPGSGPPVSTALVRSPWERPQPARPRFTEDTGGQRREGTCRAGLGPRPSCLLSLLLISPSWRSALLTHMPTHSRRPLTATLSLFAGSVPGPVGLYLPTVLGAQEVLSNCLKNGTGMVTRDVAEISPAHVGLV